MARRKVRVYVECANPVTGEMQVCVDDPGNTERGRQFQDLMLHPAVCHLLHEMLGKYIAEEGYAEQSLTLNAPG